MMRSLAIVLAVVGATASAHADPEVPDKAKALAERGRQLHHDGRYADAIEAYKAAYVLAPSPALLFNLAQVYRLSGDCDDAAWMYHRYLESQPPDDTRAIASAHLEHMAACNRDGSLDTVVPPELVPAAPLLATLVPTPPGSPSEPPPLATTSGHRSKQIGTWLVVGGGGVLVVASLAALDARHASNEVSDAYANHTRSGDLRALDERGRRSETTAAVLGVTGGLSVLAGAILYGVGHYEQANHVAVIPHAHGASVRVVWGF